MPRLTLSATDAWLLRASLGGKTFHGELDRATSGARPLLQHLNDLADLKIRKAALGGFLVGVGNRQAVEDQLVDVDLSRPPPEEPDVGADADPLDALLAELGLATLADVEALILA